jgi:hypothetical protein
LLTLNVVVGSRRNWLGEFVSFVSCNEQWDIVFIGVGCQPGKRSGLQDFSVSLAEGIVGSFLGVDGRCDDESGYTNLINQQN